MNLDREIIKREEILREWFTKDLSDILSVIDGFDIGWGGTARWTTSIMNKYLNVKEKLIFLDVACGYGTFLVELGWRFPQAQLVGLNIDFDPPHNLINTLLEKGNVQASLIAADALQLPFVSGTFDCVSCFLGLQDIAITRGMQSLKHVVSGMLQLVSPQNYLILIDNLSHSKFKEVLRPLTSCKLLFQESFIPDCRWSKEVGLKVVELYSQGYLQQELISENPPNDTDEALIRIKNNLLNELDDQLSSQGYYNPWGTMRLFLIQRVI